jgi:hypothetical protein
MRKIIEVVHSEKGDCKSALLILNNITADLLRGDLLREGRTVSESGVGVYDVESNLRKDVWSLGQCLEERWVVWVREYSCSDSSCYQRVRAHDVARHERVLRARGGCR